MPPEAGRAFVDSDVVTVDLMAKVGGFQLGLMVYV